ncbi:MAG: hypothetical protein HQM13_00810 [SAR324 cluster bacterium]|nr:hypothetical protein [SAR324 cluster bacterium]
MKNASYGSLMSFFLKAILGIMFSIIIVLMVRSGEEKEQVRTKILENIDKAPVDSFNFEDLSHSFNPKNTVSNAGGKPTATLARGKIIQWVLDVYEMKGNPDYYQIDIAPKEEIAGINLFVYPRTGQEEQYVQMLKEGSSINIKGMVQKVTKEKITINPAIILMP